MREELGKNEEIVAQQQTSKVKRHRANPQNIPRRYVGSFWVIFWFVLALLSLSLWMLRLLGVIHWG